MWINLTFQRGVLLNRRGMLEVEERTNKIGLPLLLLTHPE
jgi:hypothetical protein